MKKHRFLATFTACTLLALSAFGSFTEAAAADSRTEALTAQAESYFQFHKDTQHWGEAKTYISAKDPFSYAVQYPVTNQAALDEQIIRLLKTKADDFEKTYQAEAIQQAEEKTSDKHTGTLFVSYDAYITEDNIASVSFLETHKIDDAVADPATWSTYLFDAATSKSLTAADIFRDSYREKASAYAIDYFQNNETYGSQLFGNYKTILAPESDVFSTFALTDKSVIFYLDKYELLPGKYGAIRLEIPREVFKGSFLTDPEEIIPPPVVEEPAQPEENPSEATEGTGRVIDPNKPMVALTYDDGPSPTATNAILDVLEKYNAVATFYDVGYRVSQYPNVVKREAALGCEVGSHSYDHKDFKKLTAAQIQTDVKQVNEAFAKAGVKPTSFRPPYGNTNATVQANIPLPIVTWSVDTLDWKTRNVDSILKEVKSAGNLDGKVILMHGIYDTTAQATAKLVPMLQEQGYQLVTVSELIQYQHNETPQAGKLYGYSYFQ